MAHGRDIKYIMPNGTPRFLPEGFGEKLGAKRAEDFTPPESEEDRLAEQDLTKTSQATTLNPQSNKVNTENTVQNVGFAPDQLATMAIGLIERFYDGSALDNEADQAQSIIDAAFAGSEIPSELEDFSLGLSEDSAGKLKDLTGKFREALALDKKFTKAERETLSSYLDEIDALAVVAESDPEQEQGEEDHKDLSKQLLNE